MRQDVGSETDVLLDVIRVATLFATDLFSQDTKLEEHEDELLGWMKEHKIPEDLFPRVRTLTYALHTFAASIAENAQAYLNAKKLRLARQERMQSNSANVSHENGGD